MLLEVVLAVIVSYVLFYILKSDPSALHGVYSQPGKWFALKRFLFNLLFLLRQRHQKVTKTQLSDTNGEDDVGYGKKASTKPEKMEQPQKLVHTHDIDTVYFNGFDENGTFLIFRISRRINREAEIWLTLQLPDIGQFESPVHPDTRVYNTSPGSFSAGGLKCVCEEPMRRWRLSYSGLMRRTPGDESSEEEYVHVKFSFIWEAVTMPFDFDADIHADTIAIAVAREKWTAEFFKNLKKTRQTHYEQFGELRGEVCVEGEEVKRMTLKSFRDHSYGVRDWSMFHRYIIHFGWMEDGTSFHVNSISIPGSLTYLQCGYVSYPCGELHPVHRIQLDLPALGEDGKLPDQYTFTFQAGIRSYKAEVCLASVCEYRHCADWGNVIYECVPRITVNGVKTHGVSEFCYRDRNSTNPVPLQKSVELLQEPISFSDASAGALALPFTEPDCCSSALVGGKGCQLAQLTQLKSQEFVVPKGFCLTISAFEKQLAHCESLVKGIATIAEIACGHLAGDLPEECVRVVDAFQSASLCDEVQQAVLLHLQTLFTHDFANLKFAVRSSAAGEDSDELSAAGQMETILGVRGLSSIHNAVLQCWASHFALPAVEYRRQHGQPIRSSMGVVIQQMVPAESAGVLFTQEPVSGNPGRITINASYGLGESVVSGATEPDNIYVSRSWDDKLSVEERQIGSKQMQLTMREEGGTQEQTVTSEKGEKCCLSDDLILRLAQIGVKLEQHYSDPRDIEWAVAGDTVYLLQARPITTLDQASEWQLLHEFDTPLAMNTEIVTTANVQEMMPGAVTPLTKSVFLQAIEHSLQEFNVRQGCMEKRMNVFKALNVVCNHAFINMHFVAAVSEERALFSSYKMAHLALLGEVLEQMTQQDIRNYFGIKSPLQRFTNALRNIINLYKSTTRVKKWAAMLEHYTIGADCSTASELYRCINTDLPNYTKVFEETIYNSSRSSVWAFMTMATLTENSLEWKTEHYADVATLLSKCEDVYSADVPSALQALGEAIAASGHVQHFVELPAQAAVDWLESDASGEVGSQYRGFLQRHGFRCIREAEFREKSWQSEPTKLVTALQSIARVSGQRNVTDNRVEDVEEAIAKLKTPTTSTARFLLRKIVPRARRAVGSREWGKSISIKMVEAFKLAYWRLAELMVGEGRLPDRDLLFFFTHLEIGQLIQSRSGRLIARAQKRRKILVKQMALRFDRINVGHPQPVEENSDGDKDWTASTQIKGLPVSRGVVQGTARVVTSLTEAASIQLGDILIVHFTDVGWTPYFPLIAGLVTEIGGLVSHGAVVAREYGLPCIVNCPKATKIFTSGDSVLLNGNEGTLVKLVKDE